MTKVITVIKKAKIPFAKPQAFIFGPFRRRSHFPAVLMFQFPVPPTPRLTVWAVGGKWEVGLFFPAGWSWDKSAWWDAGGENSHVLRPPHLHRGIPTAYSPAHLIICWEECDHYSKSESWAAGDSPRLSLKRLKEFFYIIEFLIFFHFLFCKQLFKIS